MKCSAPFRKNSIHKNRIAEEMYLGGIVYCTESFIFVDYNNVFYTHDFDE
jgi:hypothetical protein